jgi:hypothetical protein
MGAVRMGAFELAALLRTKTSEDFFRPSASFRGGVGALDRPTGVD